MTASKKSDKTQMDFDFDGNSTPTNKGFETMKRSSKKTVPGKEVKTVAPPP